jgi:glutathione S-transferase
MPTVSAFKNSPDKGQGHARDFRVRWALEEVGQPYDVRLLTFKELKEPEHRARHPFGKIPTFEDGDLTLFESGAILLHIAEQHSGLLPDDANARARAIAWMFAALSTVEPPIVEWEAYTMLEADERWYHERLPRVENAIRERLGELSAALGESDWLDGEFSVADLLMVTVLRRLEGSNIPGETKLLDEFPNLAAYVTRGKQRPAYKRAFEAQKAVFTGAPSPIETVA